jgi:hypothetical protein
MPPLEWMLGGTTMVVSGFFAVKALPSAEKIGMPSPVPTTWRFSA